MRKKFLGSIVQEAPSKLEATSQVQVMDDYYERYMRMEHSYSLCEFMIGSKYNC